MKFLETSADAQARALRAAYTDKQFLFACHSLCKHDTAWQDGSVLLEEESGPGDAEQGKQEEKQERLQRRVNAAKSTGSTEPILPIRTPFVTYNIVKDGYNQLQF